MLKQTLPCPLRPSKAGPGGPEFAVEVALLQQDVVFEAKSNLENNLVGGHSIVHMTPGVLQRIERVQFEKFGWVGQLGTYVITQTIN